MLAPTIKLIVKKIISILELKENYLYKNPYNHILVMLKGEIKMLF